MNDDLPTLQSLADSMNVNKSTASRWTKRDDFPCRRRPPWTSQDLEVMTIWREDLQENRNEDAPSDGHPFWRQYPTRAPEPLVLAYRPDIPSILAEDTLAQPLGVCTAVEAAIVKGGVRMTAAQASKVVEAGARLKAKLAALCETLPRWLAGEDRREIGRRLRAAVYSELEWHREAVGNAMGKDNGEGSK